MAGSSVVVLGGYGATGRVVARLVLQYTNREVIIAGRHMDRAEHAVHELAQEFPGHRARSASADASDSEALGELLAEAALVIVCTSTPQHAATVAHAALAAGCDYLDLHAEDMAWRALQPLAEAFQREGRFCVGQAGLHPGMPPVLLRYAAPYFDQIEDATVDAVMHLSAVTFEAVRSLLAFIQDSPSKLYHDGAWHPASPWQVRTADFGAPLGELGTYPSYSPDMAEVPSHLRIPRAGVYFAGFNWFVDWVVITPLVLFKLARWPWVLDAFARLARWGLQRFSSGPALTVMRATLSGTVRTRSVTASVRVAHADPYVFTAAAAVACALQLLDRSLATPGLHRMGEVVVPERLLNDLRVMGLRVDAQLPRR